MLLRNDAPRPAAPDPPPLPLPLFLVRVAAGFPSPAEDYVEGQLDLNDLCVRRPAATFFVRATGDSMRDAGISPGDLLVVDRSVRPANGLIVIAAVDGELCVKLFSRRPDGVYLLPANDAYPPIAVGEGAALEVWGVVTWVIHKCVAV